MHISQVHVIKYIRLPPHFSTQCKKAGKCSLGMRLGGSATIGGQTAIGI